MLHAVAASVMVQTRPATIKIFTMNYVSTVVEKTSVTFIAERYIIPQKKNKINNLQKPLYTEWTATSALYKLFERPFFGDVSVA